MCFVYIKPCVQINIVKNGTTYLRFKVKSIPSLKGDVDIEQI